MLSVLKRPVSECCRNAASILRRPIIHNELYQKKALIFINSTIIRRCSVQPFTNVEKFAKIRMKYVIKDKVPHTYELIYNAPMDVQMTIISTCITIFTAFFGLALVYKKISAESFNLTYSAEDNIVMASSDFEVFSFFALSVLMLISTKILVRRYVLRIYKFDNNYIAVFRGALPGMIKKRYYEAGDVESVKVGRFLGWKDGLYKLGDRKAFLIVDYFKTPYDLKVMITDPEELKELEKGDY